MQEFTEGRIVVAFPDGWRVSEPDKAAFYKKNFTHFAGGCKAMDYAAFDPAPPAAELWLIELKDYRVNAREKLICIFEEIAQKTRDSLFCLLCARANAGDSRFKDFAKEALDKSRIRVILLLEQPTRSSRLFPQILDPATATMKLRQKVRVVDPHALVANCDKICSDLPWDARTSG